MKIPEKLYISKVPIMVDPETGTTNRHTFQLQLIEAKINEIIAYLSECECGDESVTNFH